MVAPPDPQTQAFALEAERIAYRRGQLDATGLAREAGPRDPRETVGLALSGGGIRSATFALGLLRALSDADRIRHLDYLSTVSGGGYTGAFLCSHYVPREWRGDIVEPAMPGASIAFTGRDPFADDGGAAAFEHLRQSGRHLIPGGAGDAIRLAAMMTRNWLAVQAVIGLTLLAVYMLGKPLIAALLLDPWLKWEAVTFARHLPAWLWPSQWLHGFPLGHWFVASPLWVLVAIGGTMQAGLFWAYFLTRGNPKMFLHRSAHVFGPSLFMALGLVTLGIATTLGSWPPGAHSTEARAIGAAFAIGGTIAILAYAAAEFVDWWKTRRQLMTSHRRKHGGTPAEAKARWKETGSTVSSQPRVQEDRVRLLLTNWNGLCLRWVLTLAALALLDSVAQTAYLRWDEIDAFLRIGGGAAIAIPLLRQVLLKLPGLGGSGGGVLTQIARRCGRLLALAVGVALASVIGVFWAVLAHFLAWRGGPVGSLEMWRCGVAGAPCTTWLGPLGWLLATTALTIAVAIGIAFSFAFLNLSSFAHFYASRLRRAYLGATNADRRADATPTNADHVNDDVPLARYYHPNVLAPLHLINVTINDTASGASNTVHRDRRGKPLTISPAGYLYQRDAPGGSGAGLCLIPFAEAMGARLPVAGAAGPTPQPPPLPAASAAETLPLSAWVGISGAAASTGMGQIGSVGLSLLAGLANVRLGYWWSPGLAHVREPLLQNMVQIRLADELTGRFPGSDGRRWNLTDGGHFENSAAYELIRRRTAFIIVSDAAADPDYAFADLVTLTRRVKIDFDAELRFLGNAELDRVLGTRTRLRQVFSSLPGLGLTAEKEPRVGPYAALARIRYAGPPPAGLPDRRECTLLFIKPRVCGAEALDLVAYARANPPFPQQSTIDQIFDEAQWESYFSLGRVIGAHLFADPPAAGDAAAWHPADMRPLSPA